MCLPGRMLLETRLGFLETSESGSKLLRKTTRKRDASFCCSVLFASTDLSPWCRCSLVSLDHRLNLMPYRHVLFLDGVLLDQWPTPYHKALVSLFLIR